MGKPEENDDVFQTETKKADELVVEKKNESAIVAPVPNVEAEKPASTASVDSTDVKPEEKKD